MVSAVLDTLKQFVSLEKDIFRNYTGDNRFVRQALESRTIPPFLFPVPFIWKIVCLLQKVFKVLTKNDNCCGFMGVMNFGNFQMSTCILNCLTLLKASPLSKIMQTASSVIQGSLNKNGASWHLMTENHTEQLNSFTKLCSLELSKEIPSRQRCLISPQTLKLGENQQKQARAIHHLLAQLSLQSGYPGVLNAMKDKKKQKEVFCFFFSRRAEMS